MSQVISDPAEIRRFQAALRSFNGEIGANTNRIRAQLNSLGGAWRDQEYARFSQELEGVIKSFERYLQDADGYLHHLDEKASPLEDYLNRH